MVRKTQTQTEPATVTATETDRDRDRERDRGRDTGRHSDRDSDSDRETEREREGESKGGGGQGERRRLTWVPCGQEVLHAVCRRVSAELDAAVSPVLLQACRVMGWGGARERGEEAGVGGRHTHTTSFLLRTKVRLASDFRPSSELTRPSVSFRRTGLCGR